MGRGLVVVEQRGPLGLEAVELFAERGYETIVFHAIGSGGRAMEQMMKEGIIGAVFDYALGEISDEIYDGLRAGGADRLTVAGSLGLPQVLCPGGAEHLGILVEPNVVPEEWKDHTYVFHSPVVFVPRLRATEFVRVANTGISGFVDRRGRYHQMTRLFEEAVEVREVQLSAQSTVYSRTGDVVAWLALTLTLVAALPLRRLRIADP